MIQGGDFVKVACLTMFAMSELPDNPYISCLLYRVMALVASVYMVLDLLTRTSLANTQAQAYCQW